MCLSPPNLISWEVIAYTRFMIFFFFFLWCGFSFDECLGRYYSIYFINDALQLVTLV